MSSSLLLLLHHRYVPYIFPYICSYPALSSPISSSLLPICYNDFQTFLENFLFYSISIGNVIGIYFVVLFWYVSVGTIFLRSIRFLTPTESQIFKYHFSSTEKICTIFKYFVSRLTVSALLPPPSIFVFSFPPSPAVCR